METNIMNKLPASATDEEKQKFRDEEIGKGYWVGHSADGSMVSVKQ